MKFESIHEISADNLTLILNNAQRFIEWNIEPKYQHLYALADSIKESLIHFLPDDEDLIKDINDANTAAIIVNTFPSGESHPLKEGLIVLRRIFDVVNVQRADCDFLRLRWAINDYLISVKPYALEEKLNKFHATQSENRAKRKTWKGKDRLEIEKRNKEVVEGFRNSKLTLNNWAKKHCVEYGLKPRQIRNIVNSYVGN